MLRESSLCSMSWTGQYTPRPAVAAPALGRAPWAPVTGSRSRRLGGACVGNGSRANGPSGVSTAGPAGRQGPDPMALHRIHLSGGADAVPGARAAVDLLTVEVF